MAAFGPCDALVPLAKLWKCALRFLMFFVASGISSSKGNFTIMAVACQSRNRAFFHRKKQPFVIECLYTKPTLVPTQRKAGLSAWWTIFAEGAEVGSSRRQQRLGWALLLPCAPNPLPVVPTDYRRRSSRSGGLGR